MTIQTRVVCPIIRRARLANDTDSNLKTRHSLARRGDAKLPFRRISMARQMGGVGVFLKPNENRDLVIHRLAVGGSADRSGQIHPGDILVAVDDKDVQQKDSNFCVRLIQGEVGTSVKVKVWKQGNPNNPKEVWLTRTLSPEDDQSSGSTRSRSRTADVGVDFKADETGCFQVTNLKPGGPAEISKLVDIEDILYEIDGVKVLYGIGPNGRALSNIEITEMLRGPEDSTLNLRLQKGRMGRLSQALLVRKVPPYGLKATTSPMQQRDARDRSVPAQDLSDEPSSKSFGRMPLQPPPPPSDPYPTDPSPPRSPPHPPADMPVFSGSQYPSQMAWMPVPVQPKYQLIQTPVFQAKPVPIPEPPQPPPPAVTHVAERPLPEDNDDVMKEYPDGYWKVYQPTRPDRFGLGVVFKPYGNGQVRIHQILKNGPADLCRQDIEEGDWLYEIDRDLVYKQSLSKIMRMLHGKKQGQPVYLGLRRGGREDLIEVKIVKGSTMVPNNNCGVGIVFKSDPFVGGWVRVAQVLPDGPAERAVMPLKGSEVIKVNDRVLEVNGVDVTRQQFEAWEHLLRGSENTACVVTFADAQAEMYTVKIKRGTVNQEDVDPSCTSIPPPLSEAAIKAQPKALIPEKKFIPHISAVTCGISFLRKENEEVVVDHVVAGGPADKGAKFNPPAKGRRIRTGDIIMEIDGMDIYKQPVEQWKFRVQDGPAGDMIRFKFKVPNENLTYDVSVKRMLVRKPEMSIGLNFRSNPDGTFSVNGINPKGPAVGKGISIGDTLLEISKETKEHGTDRDMHRCELQSFANWKGVVAEADRGWNVKLKLRKPDETTSYTVDIPRKGVLFNVGIQWAVLGNSILVDKLLKLPEGLPSAAEREGIRVGYILQAIQNVPMVGNLDNLQLTMSELVLGEYGSKAILTFKTADGDFTFGVARDIDTNVMEPKEGPSRPRQGVPNLGNGYIRPFQATELVPGGGIFKQPMSNPELWSSLLDEGRPIIDANGRAREDKSHLFTWRGRILSQPEYSQDHSVCKVWDVGGLDNEDSSKFELTYYGPGMREPRVPLLPGQYVETNIKQNPLPTHQTVQIPKTVQESAEKLHKYSMRQNKPVEKTQPEQASKVPPPPTPAKVTKPAVQPIPAPPPPTKPMQAPTSRKDQPPPPPPPPEEGDEDDETILQLSDGSIVEAVKIEKILKEHLEAVAHIMVVGSNKKFLTCLLTLKTAGWEAEERGEDSASMATRLELVGAALQLAKKVGSKATTVVQARQDADFRSKGLLPQFTSANQKITVASQQVRRFSILPNPFSKRTGELKPDGSLNRLKIKTKYKNFIEGMYQEKK